MCITLVHKVRASAVSQSPVPPASDVVANRHSTVPPDAVTAGECASPLLKLAVTQELVHCVYVAVELRMRTLYRKLILRKWCLKFSYDFDILRQLSCRLPVVNL